MTAQTPLQEAYEVNEILSQVVANYPELLENSLWNEISTLAALAWGIALQECEPEGSA